MTTKVDPQISKRIRKFGAGDFNKCYHCGTCTAICPLSVGGVSFPRRVLRNVQLGLQDRLMQAPEPWLCYYCGECSESCPQKAEPAETMAAMRRYLIAQYDPSGLAGLMFRSPAFTLFFTLLLAALLGFFLLSIHAGKHAIAGAAPFPAHWAPFPWIPYETIHLIGMGVGALMVLMVLTGLFNAARMMLKPHGGFAALRQRKAADIHGAFAKLGREIATMQRHGQCDADSQPAEPWYLRPRFAHGMILAGFVALLIATTLDFLFVFALKMQFYGIARPVGTIGGLAMLYGLLVYTWKRMRRATPNTKTTTLADAWLLFFLILLDLTGVALLVIIGTGWKGVASDVILLVHSVMAMEILLLFPLTKVAHALYRPLALFFHFLNEPQTEA